MNPRGFVVLLPDGFGAFVSTITVEWKVLNAVSETRNRDEFNKRILWLSQTCSASDWKDSGPRDSQTSSPKKYQQPPCAELNKGSHSRYYNGYRRRFHGAARKFFMEAVCPDAVKYEELGKRIPQGVVDRLRLIFPCPID